VGDFLSFEGQAHLETWKARSQIVEQMPMEAVSSYLRFSPASALALVDAIVCMADGDLVAYYGYRRHPAFDFPVEKAVALAEDVRKLPEVCTMRDGRKWKAVPFAIFSAHHDLQNIPFSKRQVVATIYPPMDPMEGLDAIRVLVDKYHDRVLSDYENLGILVHVTNGHVQIGPALLRKRGANEGDYYHAHGDRRTHRRLVTVKRDYQGLRADISLLQELLERRANEREMHRFFEEHPAILMEARLGIPISHRPRFSSPEANTPDFSFSPILGPWNTNVVELMELKGPAETTLYKGVRRGFTAKVTRAVDQVRDYARYLRQPENYEAVVRDLGYKPDESKLAVLIGRAPTVGTEREVWEQRQRELDVKVVTYDEILATQVNQLKPSAAYTVKYGTPGYPPLD
jgi:hypothetical protein